MKEHGKELDALISICQEINKELKEINIELGKNNKKLKELKNEVQTRENV